MSRPLRIEYPGAVYHITARGNRKADIFIDDHDRIVFLKKLTEVVTHHNWLCHAYCLMGNHYHLLIETIDPNLSDGMRDLNKAFSQAFNRRHNTVGHLLQGRFKSFIIEKEPYLLEVARYTVLNPVRAGLVKDPAEWKWSSYRATAGLERAPAFLTTDWILSQFHDDNRRAQQQYREFVSAGIGAETPFASLSHKAILGSPQFVYDMWERTQGVSSIKEIAREERMINRPSLQEMFPDHQTKTQRNSAIVMARVLCGYSVAEIARRLDMSQTQVSVISRDVKNRRPKT